MLSASKKRITRGSAVALFGELAGEADCSESQVVKLQARRPGTKRFKVLRVVATDDVGTYIAELGPRRTKEYRAVAPATETCDRAVSAIRIVRVS